MSEIFISYSSLERDQALRLVAILRAQGYEPWIDSGRISGAMNWSSEIVEAINQCSVVIFLISPHSATSHNCSKEIFLASEKRKHIIPIVLEETSLPVAFEYPLAGLKRIPITDTDLLIRTLEQMLTQRSASAPAKLQTEDIDALRLAVLPFEDLSPSHDNEWFADGMTDELIDTLGSLEKLVVNPRNDVIYYKGKHPRLDEVAADLNARFIVAGSVQKAGEKIRIRVSLSDVRDHAQIWSEKYDGAFDDIFDLQDKTARAISEALQLKLTTRDQEKITDRPTNQPEAYEFYLKGVQYHRKASREAYESAIRLYSSALEIDPNFAEAYLALSNSYQAYYRTYSRDTSWLVKAEEAAQKALAIEGRTSEVIAALCSIKLKQGKVEEALRDAQEAVRLNPLNPFAHTAVGFAYKALGNWQEVRKAREEFIKLRHNDTNGYFALLVAIKELGDEEGLRRTAEEAIPIYERYLRLNPDDLNAAVEFLNILRMAAKQEAALQKARELIGHPLLDGPSLYNLSCLFCSLGDPETGLVLFRKSLEKGYRDIETIKHDSDICCLHEFPEFASLLKALEEQILAEATA